MQSHSESARRGRSARLRAVLRAACVAVLLGGGVPAGAVPDGVVNVNTATADELARLPGVGESKARAILDYRKERGAFKSVEQLREVKGIGDAALERMRPHVALEGKTTLP
jgi:competence protein ComEA